MKTRHLLAWVGFCALTSSLAGAEQAAGLTYERSIDGSSIPLRSAGGQPESLTPDGTTWFAKGSLPQVIPKLSASHMQSVLGNIKDVNFDNAADHGSEPARVDSHGFGVLRPSDLSASLHGQKPVAFFKSNPADHFLRESQPDQASPSLRGKESPFTASMLLSPACGVLFTRIIYPGQKDKYLHSYAGAGISVVSMLATSWVIGGTDYSLKSKKVMIKLIGPIAGLSVGLLKEYVYDNARKDRHTVDIHDALATGLGAGIIPVSFIFNF